MWDEYKREDFNLRALLFVTINDWSALSILSGQSNKGYRACTHCLEDTDSIWLTHCRKCVYMGHRRFLPVRHQVLKKCVRNRARPEGSIASAYETEEVIDFCVDFIDDLKPIGVPELRYEGRLNGKGTLGKKSHV